MSEYTLPIPANPPGDFKFTTSLDNVPYVFRFQWVDRDSAWYMSIYDVSAQPIGTGIKVVIGAYLGSRYITAPLFQNGVIVAVDLAASSIDTAIDAGRNDFGTRVVVRYVTVLELLSRLAIINADS